MKLFKQFYKGCDHDWENLEMYTMADVAKHDHRLEYDRSSDTWYQWVIFTEPNTGNQIYVSNAGVSPSMAYDRVCLKCGKCIEGFPIVRKAIWEVINMKRDIKYRNDKRSKLAKKLWRDCKDKGED